MGYDEEDGKSVLLELVTKAKAWSVLADFRTSTPSERTGILVKAFVESCTHHDDEYALQLFTWLLQAIQEEDDFNSKPVEGTDWETKETAKKLAKTRVVLAQADAAKTLYPLLPEFRLEPPYYTDQSGTKHSTLLKTKRVVLEAIANGWRSAPTDDSADEFFMFIYRVDSGLRDGSGDREIINETIRKVMGGPDLFPLARLMYTLRNHPSLYEDILAHAWVKNGYFCAYRSKGSKVGLILGAVGDFYEASREATKLLERVGAKILAVDHQLRSLNDLPSRIFGPPNLEFVYDRVDKVVASFKVTGSEEKELHKAFELVRARILEASKSWSIRVEIRLHGELVPQYGNRVIHQRTEDI